MRTRNGALAGLVLFCVSIIPAGSVGEGEDAGIVRGSVRTFERIWSKGPAKRGLGKSGDLTVSDESLAFTTPKRAVSIPWREVRFVSLGKLRGDVDTDWVVLSVGEPGLEEIVAFKDGSKLGYGGRTPMIFDTIRTAARRARAAQFEAPPGYRAYADFDRQFTFAIPESWNAHVDSIVYVDGLAVWGTVLLSEEPVRRSAGEGPMRDAEAEEAGALASILAGRMPAYFLERLRADSGMSCDGFSNKGRRTVVDRAGADLVSDEESAIVELPSAEDVTIAGCVGLHVVGRSRGPDGSELVVDLYAVVHRETLFLLGMRAVAERYESYLEPFNTAVGTLKFPVAR